MIVRTILLFALLVPVGCSSDTPQPKTFREPSEEELKQQQARQQQRSKKIQEQREQERRLRKKFEIKAQDNRKVVSRYVVLCDESTSIEDVKLFIRKRRNKNQITFIYFWNNPSLTPNFLPGGKRSLLWSEEQASNQLANYIYNPNSGMDRLIFKGQDLGKVHQLLDAGISVIYSQSRLPQSQMRLKPRSIHHSRSVMPSGHPVFFFC